MLQTHISTLLPYLTLFKKSKEDILHHWVDQELIETILNHHDVDIDLFINYYAAGVFDYFISVIKGETPLGTCPAMEEFLAYLKGKNFHADELFILCSHFKKAMVDNSYIHHINSQKIFSAISFLFDANFSGVLRLYTDTIYQKEQVIAKSLSLLNEYKNAIDVSAIVAKTDIHGVITYASDNFCKLSGYSKEELLGSNHNIVRHQDTTDAFYQEMWQAIKSNSIFQGTIKNAKKDSSAYYIDLTIVPLSDPMQGVQEYISIGYDVTTLVKAKEEAFEASKAKERFLSAMSHEIRTPLNAILGFISILQEQTQEDLNKHYLNIISHSGKHLLQIINDILDFSKLQNSLITAHNDIFNTHEVFNHLVELFAQSAKEKHLTLEASIDSKLPAFIYADAMRIQQVISNLLGNAIKFTPKDGLVKLFIFHQDRELMIKVQDNGIGITKEAQDTIFNPFVQAEKDHEGTGLGLAITRELITAMQGEITLESRPNKGTCFSVTLPFKLAQTKEIQSAQKPEALDKKKFKAHILVAEDNEDNQELISLLLKRFGLTFQLVSDGEQALKAFQKNSFDMLILDDEMPIMRGYKTASNIREFEKYNHKHATPIMLLSANATNEVKHRAISHGCDIFLSKPIDIHKLQDAFDRYLHQSGVINTRRLADDLLLQEDEVSHLLSIFEKNLPKNLNLLHEAITLNNRKKIAKMAHKIKGSASNFHFVDIIKICSSMENKALKDEEANYLDYFETLIQSLELLGLNNIALT